MSERMSGIPGLDFPGDPQPESRFFEPTPLCPHPDRWTATDGDSTEIEVAEVAYGLVRAIQPDFCLETGAGFGQTTSEIGRALQQNGRGELIALENDQERASYVAERCTALPVRVLTESSLEWTPSSLHIDFAWLDTFYEMRVPEFSRLHRIGALPAGAIVCFHDTSPGRGAHRMPSGNDLRHEIESQLGEILRFVHLPTPRGITIAEVIQ